MTGLDTNVLVRFLAQDDERQRLQAVAVMSSLSEKEPGWIGLAVLMELMWVMTSIFRFTRPQMIRVLNDLLSRRDIVIDQSDVVRGALLIYVATNVGFADCLIACSALAAGCRKTLTFDIDAAKYAGMTLVR